MSVTAMSSFVVDSCSTWRLIATGNVLLTVVVFSVTGLLEMMVEVDDDVDVVVFATAKLFIKGVGVVANSVAGKSMLERI